MYEKLVSVYNKVLQCEIIFEMIEQIEIYIVY